MPVERASDMDWINDGNKPVPRQRPSAPVPIAPDNRRRHTRFQVASAQVMLRQDGFLTVLNLGSNKARKVCDLSQSGARILCSEKFVPKQKVRLKITLEKYQDEIEINGEVMWCLPSTNKKDFYVGIRFATDDAATNRRMAALQEWFTSPQYQALRSRR